MDMGRAILEALSGKRWDDDLYSEAPEVEVREWGFDELKGEVLRFVHGEGGYGLQHATPKEHGQFLHALREFARKELVALAGEGSNITSAKITEKGLALLESGDEIPSARRDGKECPRCGYVNAPDAEACSACNESLAKTEQDIAQEEARAYFEEKRGKKQVRFERRAEGYYRDIARVKLRYAGAILGVYLFADILIERGSYCRLGMLLGNLIVHGLVAYAAAHILVERGGGAYLGMLFVSVLSVVGCAIRGALGLSAIGGAASLFFHIVLLLWVPVGGGFLVGYSMEDTLRRKRGAG